VGEREPIAAPGEANPTLPIHAAGIAPELTERQRLL
jgi:hypothetical protein